jgi:hypothetical protein
MSHTTQRLYASAAAVAAFSLWTVIAHADDATAPDAPPGAPGPATTPTLDTGGAADEPRVKTDDPTGGAYTSPTLLFVPAAAVPKWNARVIASTELQSPSDVHAAFRPGMGGELGLPGGFTIGAGTNWVGGDVNRSTGQTDAKLGISPYAQVRFHVLGAADGQGFQLGAGVHYKVVGFGGNPGEAELSVSAQYRHRKYEFGLQAVVGQELEEGDKHDGEMHAYAVYRVIPELALGAAGQVRTALGEEEAEKDALKVEKEFDAVGGAIASLTLGRYSLGALGGVSTLGLDRERAGALAQLFGTARF